MPIERIVHKNVPKFHEDPETGEVDTSKTPRLVEEEEVKVTGKDVQDPELAKVFRKSSETMLNQIQARRRKYGVLKLTDPSGNVGQIYAHEEQKYKNLGWGKTATRPTFTNPWGRTKIAGRYRRSKAKFIDGKLVEYFVEEK